MKTVKLFLFFFLLSMLFVSAQGKDQLDAWKEAGEYEKMYRTLVEKKKKTTLSDKEFSYLIFSAQITENDKNALAFATEWEAAAKKRKDSATMVKAMNYRIKIYHATGQCAEAVKLGNFLVKYYQRNANPQKVVQNQMTLGLCLADIKETKRAKEVYDAIDQTFLETDGNWVDFHVNYSYINADLKNYPIALEHAEKAIALQKKMNVMEEISLGYINISSILFETKKYKKALTFLDSAEIYIQQYQNLRYRQMIYQNRYSIWAALGNTDSIFSNLEKLREVDKKIVQEDLNEEMESLKMSFKKENELRNMVEASQRQVEKNRLRNLLLLILALLLTLGAICIYYFFKVKSIKTDTKNAELEMKLLRSQINPHFIFNTLASIQSLIRQQKNEESIAYLNSFSKFARQVLDTSRKSNITLDAELELIKKYVELQKLRKDNFDFELKTTEEIDEIKDEILFPAMSLQPFIENAILHGFKNIDYRGHITVSVEIIGNHLHLVINDNGTGIKGILPNEHHQSHAINIIKERLHSLDRELKTKSRFFIGNKPHGKGVVVEIEIPLISSSNKTLSETEKRI